MQEYLYRREIGQSAENALIKVSFNGVNAFPQINNGISQLFTLKLWCQSLLGADVAADELSDGAYEWLHENIQVFKGMTSIEHHFYPNGIGDAEADGLLRLVQTESDAEFEVLCWLLKNKLAENSYLKWVLADKTIARNVILDAYVCKVRENRH